MFARSSLIRRRRLKNMIHHLVPSVGREFWGGKKRPHSKVRRQKALSISGRGRGRQRERETTDPFKFALGRIHTRGTQFQEGRDSQTFCDVAVTVKFHCKCDVAKSFRMGPSQGRKVGVEEAWHKKGGSNGHARVRRDKYWYNELCSLRNEWKEGRQFVLIQRWQIRMVRGCEKFLPAVA